MTGSSSGGSDREQQRREAMIEADRRRRERTTKTTKRRRLAWIVAAWVFIVPGVVVAWIVLTWWVGLLLGAALAWASWDYYRRGADESKWERPYGIAPF
jgi:Flp pilus assembly protein TadB